MDRRIIDLKPTAFSGRRVNRQQIADIQETVWSATIPWLRSVRSKLPI